MKRIILLAAALILLLALPAAAENRLLEADGADYVRRLLTVGDRLVLSAEERLYTWREGEDGFTAWTPELHLENPYYQGNQFEEEVTNPNLGEITFFDDGGALRGLRLLRDENFEYRAIQLFDAAFSDAGTFTAENVVELPLPGEIGELEWFNPSEIVCRDGVLYILGEGEDMALCVIDPERPRDAAVERLQSWDNGLTALPDGALLAAGSDDGDGLLTLSRVDADGALEPLCSVRAEAASLAADPETGAVYAALNGRVCPVDMDTGELGEAVAALPLGADGAEVLPGGLYAASMGNGSVAVLDIRGRLDDGAVLRVSSSWCDEWMNKAVLRFAAEHPEVAPVLGYDAQGALEAMMTRSGDTDVYIMDLTYEADFQALLERGYMLPLDGSEAVSALYDRLYPGVRPCVGRDGVPMALPVAVRGEAMCVGVALLEELGLSAEDVPDSWPDFLDFMEDELRPRLDMLGERESFTYDGMTVAGFRFFLFQSILRDWVQANRAAGKVANYEDPRLTETLDKLDGMDFAAYGLEEDEEEDGFGYSWSDDTRYLIQISNEFTPDNSFGSDGMPVALGFGGDLPGVFTLNLSCAFVNPYSPRAESAVAFVDALARALPAQVEYALCPDMNEPLKRDDWEKVAGEYEQTLAQWEARVEDAEPSEKQELEDTLNRVRQEYDWSLERDIWLIPEDRLRQYRALGDKLSVALPTWFDSNGEAWQLMEQYRTRAISARDFLREVNNKARMMELEQG